jgi:glutamate racemase
MRRGAARQSRPSAAIELAVPAVELDVLVERGVAAPLAQTGGAAPHRAILGCTHYPLVEDAFRRHLPPFTRLLSQPEVVADSLEDYLQRHPRYVEGAAAAPPLLLTTGEPERVNATARIFWPEAPAFRHLALQP